MAGPIRNMEAFMQHLRCRIQKAWVKLRCLCMTKTEGDMIVPLVEGRYVLRHPSGRRLMVAHTSLLTASTWLDLHAISGVVLDERLVRDALVMDLETGFDEDFVSALVHLFTVADHDVLDKVLGMISKTSLLDLQGEIVRIVDACLPGREATYRAARKLNAYPATRLITAVLSCSERTGFAPERLVWIAVLSPQLYLAIQVAWGEVVAPLGVAVASHWRAEFDAGHAISRPMVEEALLGLMECLDRNARHD
jgi:hypothetical protein